MLHYVNVIVFTCVVSFYMGNSRVLALSSNDSQELNSAYTSRSKIIAIEGMPGAGKTSVLAAIAEELEGTCIFLSEMNLEPNSPWKKLSSKEQGDIFHQLWVERIALLNTFKDPRLCFLLDRTYFSNLAFVYALDTIKGTHLYQAHKKAFQESFSNNKFELILVFDISPEIGLQRRQLRGDKVPWPWSSIAFLTAMRQFYKVELPKLTQGNILYINTDKDRNIIKNEVLAEILSLVDKNYHLSETSNENQAEIIHNFAKINNLGKANTRVINVLGVPTIYFLKYSVQLEEGKPVFFNNHQLYRTSCRYNSLVRQPNGE